MNSGEHSGDSFTEISLERSAKITNSSVVGEASSGEGKARAGTGARAAKRGVPPCASSTSEADDDRDSSSDSSVGGLAGTGARGWATVFGITLGSACGPPAARKFKAGTVRGRASMARDCGWARIRGEPPLSSPSEPASE